MGKQGTMLIKEDEYVHEEPKPREDIFNETDSFNGVGSGNIQDAAVIHGLLNGWDIGYVADYANDAAGLRLRGIDFRI